MMECGTQEESQNLATIPMNKELLLLSLYSAIIAIACLIAAYSHRLYSTIRTQNFLIQEKVPLALGDEDLVGKETAYRNTKLTGMTQAAQDGPTAEGGAGGTTEVQIIGGNFGNVTFEADSNKEQITLMEEKMNGPSKIRKLEKPKSVGLKKEISGPRSVFL